MTAAAEACHFVDVLDRHARRLGGRDAVLFLADGRRVSASVSFAALRRDALEIAGGLRRRYRAQARVLIMLPSGLDYVGAFLGCLYGNLVAVPLFPPVSRPRHLERIHRIIADAAPAAILCEAPARPVLQTLLSERNIAADVLAVDQLRDAGAPETPDLRGDTLAFLQYTSGSTVAPKGVMVQHRQLLANCRLMQHARGFAEDDRMVSWLPLYHDMGLIGGLLTALYCAMPCYLMASQTFARTPSVWLEALSNYQGSVSFAPNFAYALCSRAVDDAVIDRLDLRRWRHAVNGAEPVHPATLDEFCRRFARAGFRPDAFSPGYGQAEATLCVSIALPGQPPLRLAVDTRALAAGQVRPARDGAPATVLAACGCPQPGHDVAVVDPQTGRRCAAGEVGELWLRGPSIAAGYWRNATATAAAFRARLGDDGDYLRSGDLGFLHQGQVVICGRLH
nr:AMP-binding protein [Pseudomonadota bacterium]